MCIIYICLYVCMYVCMYVRMYVCVHVCVYVCVYIYIHTHTYIYIYMHTYICIGALPSSKDMQGFSRHHCSEIWFRNVTQICVQSSGDFSEICRKSFRVYLISFFRNHAARTDAFPGLACWCNCMGAWYKFMGSGFRAHGV